jgi:hypothetical protein
MLIQNNMLTIFYYLDINFADVRLPVSCFVLLLCLDIPNCIDNMDVHIIIFLSEIITWATSERPADRELITLVVYLFLFSLVIILF